MAISRVVYTKSGLTLTPSNALVNGGSPFDVQTAQNATYTVNVPRENVNSIGYEGPVDRPQLDAADASIEFTFIPHDATGSGSITFTGARVGEMIQHETKSQAPSGTQVTADGIGQVDKALMGSLTADASVGALATMTASFTGAPNTSTGTANATATASGLTVNLVEPKDLSAVALASTSTDTSGAGFDQPCAQSVAVAWDLPIVNVLCLGSDPTNSANYNPFGNPPGTSSITIEGLSEALNYTSNSVANVNYVINIGEFDFTLINGKIDSQTNSVAVGEVFSTFNYVIGGTGDGFTVG